MQIRPEEEQELRKLAHSSKLSSTTISSVGMQQKLKTILNKLDHNEEMNNLQKKNNLITYEYLKVEIINLNQEKQFLLQKLENYEKLNQMKNRNFSRRDHRQSKRCKTQQASPNIRERNCLN